MKSTKLLFLSLTMMVLLLTFASCFGGETVHIHAFGQWENKILPTCITDGLESRVCSCGELEEQVISATGHVEQILPERAATCSVGGLTEGKQCVNCGEILVKQIMLPKLHHTEIVIDWGKPATCTEKGLSETKQCTVCNQISTHQKVLPMIPHEEIVIAESKPATCTEAGLTEIKQCTVCNQITASAQVIPMIPHEAIIIEGRPATCSEAGITEGKKCALCDTILEEPKENIPPLGHEFIISTETDENGKTTVYGSCLNCGETEKNPGGLYDDSYNLVATWEELVWEYKLDVEKRYNDDEIGITKTHFTYIMNNNEQLQKASRLIIDDSVTFIGNNAFANCTFLKSVYVPSSVTEIYYHVFAYCTSLIEVEFCDELKYMNRVFYYCESLKKIALPEGITHLTMNELEHCTSLEYIYFPASLESIDYLTLIDCYSIKYFDVAEDNPYFTTINGHLYSKDETKLIRYASGNEDKTYILSDHTTVIETYAFAYSTHVETVYLHSKITEISKAFSNSSSLKDVYYSGTEEQWDAMNMHVANYAHDLIYHYDGIIRFFSFRFAGDPSSSGAYGIVHVIIDGDDLYVFTYQEKIHYPSITKVDNLNIEFSDQVYHLDQYDDKEERLAILEKIQAHGEWYLLKGVDKNGKERTKVICYIDGVFYHLDVWGIDEETNTMTVYTVTSAKVSLENYYEK